VTDDRILGPLRALVQEEVSRLRFLASWEYTVVGVNGDGTINCSSPTAPLPSLNNVPISPGAAGETGAPTPGNNCTVRFVNGDPARYRIVGNAPLVRTATFDATDTVNVGPSVSNAVILAGGSAPVARMGDAVQVYFPTAPMVLTTGILTGPPPTSTPLGTFTATLVVAGPAVGTITTGNPKVLA
jgi:hypothetical protein